MLLQFSPLAFAQSPACALLVLGWGTARRPSGCCQLLARAWVPVADVRGRLLRGAWVAGVRGHPVAGVRLHFGRWGTAREDLRVLPAFATRSACVSACCGRARALVAGVREFCCGRRAPSNAAVADGLPRHKRQRLTQPSGCQTLVYTSRFVRVILAQGHADLFCIVPILTDDPRRESSDAMK